MYINDGKNKLKLIMAKSYFKRLKGFMFKKNIDYAICFPKCNSIHTFFMKEKIDVYMTDKDNKVLYIYKNLKKNRIILPKKGVYKIFELPVDKIFLKVGNKIKIED